MALNRMVTTACVAFLCLMAVGTLRAQSFQNSANVVLYGRSDQDTSRVLLMIDSKQQDTKRRLGELQAELDKVRFDDRNPEQAKNSLINLQHDSLEQLKKRYVVLETAKLAVVGQDIPKQLTVYFPDVIESIASLANPVLPLCGNKLTYRGDSNQVSWNLTLDTFLTKFGHLLAAVGRLEADVVTYTQGPAGPERTLKRINLGTGFAVSENQVVTAGHVAALFWDFESKSVRDRIQAVYFNPGGEHRFNCHSVASPAIRKLAAVSRTKYEPNSASSPNLLDFAVIDLASGEAAFERLLPIAQNAPAISAYVVVVGYPAEDSRVDRDAWRTMMQVPVDGGMFPIADIKRIAPGMVVPKCSNAQQIHLPHNATTLNRSSGSPIISVETGEVVGIQVAGFRDIGGGDVYCNLGLRSNAPEVSLR